MHALAGILFHFLGGFASGSFYIPYKKVKGWAWESYWIVGGIFSWLIIPFLAAQLTIPDFMSLIHSSDHKTLVTTYALGVLWGIGGLTFGLTMRYLGLSLGMSIVLGYCSAFGALIPPIYRDIFTRADEHTLSAMLISTSGLLVLSGVVVCLAGIFICGKAGSRKEKELSEQAKKENIKEFNLLKGVSVATLSGVLSACFNFGIEAGKPMARMALENGAHPLFQNNIIFVVLLWGGLTTNLIWCLLLNFRNKTFTDYRNTGTPLLRNYIFSGIAGTMWFLQFFFYGMGESKLGNGSSSWILHMAFIILISNTWGILLREWEGVSKRTMHLVLLGVITVTASVILVGLGNYIQEE